MSIGRPLDSRVDQEEQLGARLADTDIRLSRLERQTDSASINESIFVVDTFQNLPEPQPLMFGLVLDAAQPQWYTESGGIWVQTTNPIPPPGSVGADFDTQITTSYGGDVSTPGTGALLLAYVDNNSTHMALDGNEIQAWTAGVGSTLNLNIADPTGKVQVGGVLQVNGDLDVNGNIIGDGVTDITGIDDFTFYGSGSILNMNNGDISGVDVQTFNGAASRINYLDELYMQDANSWINLRGGRIDACGTVNATNSLNSGVVKSGAGSQGTPGFYCGTDSNTGIYRVAENELGITTGGGLKATFNSTGIILASSDWFRTQGSAGWYNNTHKVGIYAVGANWVTCYPSQSCGIIAEGFSYTGASGTGNYVVRNSTYGTFAYLSSTRDVKENVKTIDNEWAGDALDRMRPVEFIYKWTGEGEEPEDAKAVRLGDTEYGFIAEEVAELDPEVKLTLWDADFNPNGWSHHNVVALLVASNKKTRERVSALEAENAELKDRLAAIEAHLALN